MSGKKIFVDKSYKLKRDVSPLSYTLPTKNKASHPLMHWDSDKGENRVLRYARNQKSPFEDEQDGNVVLEPVIFIDGFLRVQKENQVLQEFLHYHPYNGVKFVEVDKQKDASEELEALDLEIEATSKARSLDVTQLERVGRVLFGKSVKGLSSKELRRDVIIFAKKNPKGLLEALQDPELTYNAKVQQFFDEGYLSFRKNNTEIWFYTPNNKKKMMSLPFNADPNVEVAKYLKSDDGIDELKMLEGLLESK
ncbi:MAG: hypothetical protein Unbinned1473contig1000_4 [Prokaryotic dsDNA virus sp.]|nr:MAG: hypothetical protein Unbinned1473contig1000_4 [Prokaryotic dsDNA virus sp.]|tara:strand:- start:13244 stop:13996 length:753 start_codon:yes stop_codon:yes gene_type:complete